MARIAKVSRPTAYSDMSKVSATFQEKNDCTVKATAAVTGLSYSEAHALLKAAGRQNGHGFSAHKMMIAIKNLGYSVVQVDPRAEFISKFPGQHKTLKNMTSYHPVRFPSAFKDGGAYLMFVSGYSHVAALVDGVTVDWSNDKPRRVAALFKVVKK